MKVLLLNQFFFPDISATAQIATELAEDLAAAGSEVTVIASRGSYLGGSSAAQTTLPRKIRIIRVPATSLGKRTVVHRALDYATFYISASAALLATPRHDAIVVMSTPPLVAAAALVASRVKRCRSVYWVQDLYPDVAIAFGALDRRSFVSRAMSWVSKLVLRRTDAVVAIGERMRLRCLDAGTPAERCVVVPNWADGAVVRPVAHQHNELRVGLGIADKTAVMYSGNLGRAHDVRTLLDAAGRLAGRSDIVFVFVGDGAQRSAVEDAARALPNVRLAPYQPREKLAASLSAGDMHLISLSPALEGLVEPSKLYGVMAAGRPVLFVGPRGSEVARTIERERCGRVIDNGDDSGLATAISQFADDAQLRRVTGERARAGFEARYDRHISTARFDGVLRVLTSSGFLRNDSGVRPEA